MSLKDKFPAATPTSDTKLPNSEMPDSSKTTLQSKESPTALPARLQKSTGPPKSKEQKTSIQFEISNTSSLFDLSKRYNPVQPQSESTVPVKRSSYFEELDVTTRLELNHGIKHIIDVQPDLRFPLQSCTFSTIYRNSTLTRVQRPTICEYLYSSCIPTNPLECLPAYLRFTR